MDHIIHIICHTLFTVVNNNLDLFLDNNEMHTINMSHNNLTKIEPDWFESFHTKWAIGEREFAGKLSRNLNSVCVI